MLKITIPSAELWDEDKEEFVYTKEQTLQLEHSLVSLSKWESKWCKAFLSKHEKTFEETVDYVKCMTLTQNVNSDVYQYLTNKNIAEINRYIEAPMTATYFSDDKIGKTSREQITSELIYYWMVALNIPFECDKWFLNNLLTLIRIASIKNAPPEKNKKKNSSASWKNMNAINRARRAKMHTNG